jgi:hypothetical protein
MSEDEPPDVIGHDDSSFEDFVAGSSARLFTTARLLTGAGPAGTRIPEIYAPGLTLFWEGYVTDLRGCIPVQVRASAASPPIRVTLAAGAGNCGS